MPDFSKLFVETGGKPLRYNSRILVPYDDIPFECGDRFLVRFEKTNSEWTQGIGLSVFGFIEIEALGKRVKDQTFFMENTAPKEIFIKVWEDDSERKQPKRLPKKGVLGVKNVWDAGRGTISSWVGGAAMTVEEIENGRRYRCNDGHPDDNFDDIVFTITKALR